MIDSRGILVGIAASLLVAGGYVVAQEDEHEGHHPEAQAQQGEPDADTGAGAAGTGAGTMQGMRSGGMKHCKMMGGGMMGGGGGMMGGGMMGGGMMDRMIHIPKLPPGNEKLQLMMQAEILQKVGEVQAKYAAQIKEPGTPAQ